MLEFTESLESRDIELSFDMSDRRLSQLERGSLLSSTVSDSESVAFTVCKRRRGINFSYYNTWQQVYQRVCENSNKLTVGKRR